MSDETRNEGEQDEAIKVHLDTTKDYVIRSIQWHSVEYTVKGNSLPPAYPKPCEPYRSPRNPPRPKTSMRRCGPRFEVSEHSTGKRVAYGKRGEDALSVAIRRRLRLSNKLVSDMGGADAFHERLAYQAKSNEPIPFEEVFPY